MNFYIVSAFSFSIFIPGITALFLFKKIGRNYYPFLFCLWIGCINEVVSFILLMHHHYTTINNNIYVLLEALLLTWYFREAGLLKNSVARFGVAGLLVLFWVIESFFIRDLSENSTYFRIFTSLLIAFFSINVVNRALADYQPRILQNPDFLLCTCFIIYFTYKAMIQAFIIYGITRNVVFLQSVYIILLYVNLGVNLAYTLAVIWMPRKLRFMLPLSSPRS